MNLRKQIVIVLLTLVLYKTIEPLAFCISYLYQSSLISSDESLAIYQEVNSEDSSDAIISEDSKKTNGITSIEIKLNGNRLSIEKEKLFNDAMANLLHNQQEKQKPPLPSIDFNINYLCPENDLHYNNSNIINFLRNWSYNDKSYNCFLAILTPPPKQVGEPFEV